MLAKTLLDVKRFLQKPNECSVAACASLANFFSPEIKYSDVRLLVSKKKRKSGLYTSETASLLNDLGFECSVCSADLEYLDYSWQNLSKNMLISRLTDKISYFSRKGEIYLAAWVQSTRDWLARPDCDNQLIIDNDWSKHIKHQLNLGRPLCASINWTSTFKRSKVSKGPGRPDINGEVEEHEVVIRGYDDKGVFIVDSHQYTNTGQWKKYSKGYYKLPWSKLLTNMPSGDLIWVN